MSEVSKGSVGRARKELVDGAGGLIDADDEYKRLWRTILYFVLGLFTLGAVWLLTVWLNSADASGGDEGQVATIADTAWFSEVLYWAVVIITAGLAVFAAVVLIRMNFRDFDLAPLPVIAGWVELEGDKFVVTSDDGEVLVLDPAKVRHTSIIIDPSIQTGYLRNDSLYHRSLVLPPRVWKAYRRALRWGR